jgi:cellobiose PTS system EIIA component
MEDLVLWKLYKKQNREILKRLKKLLKQSTEELGKAHKFQTQLIQAEADGKSNPVNILLVHAQDHLMTAMTVRDLAAEIVELYKTK